jgi:hypothetical protein
MIEELINFYRGIELFNFMDRKNKFINTLFILTPFSYLFYQKIAGLFRTVIWEFLSMIILAIPFIIMWFIYNYTMKELLNKKYSIYSKTFFWNSYINITKLQKEYNLKIKYWLIENNYYDKINLIISELNKRKDRNYVKPPVFTIAVGSVLLILWDKYFEKMYIAFEDPINISMLNYTTLVISLIIIIVGIMIFILKQSLNFLWEYVINKDIKIIEKTQKILNDIQFDKELNM